MSRRHLLLLAAAVTDSTFARATVDGQKVWVGKCIHCGSKLVVREDGRAMGDATLEHVQPRAQEGDNSIRNLAVACGRCNREKGARHDHGRGDRARHEEIIARLIAARLARWRDPEEVGMAGRLAALVRDE